MSVARLLEALLLSSLCVAFLLLALPETRRTGYAPDEEVTFFAVEGIRRHGIPSMPSGAIYARGLAYTYACAAAGALLGFDLPVYRGVSLAAALLGLPLVYLLARRRAGAGAAALAAALWGSSPWCLVLAQWARPYALLLLASLVALAGYHLCSAGRRAGALLAAGILLAVLAHESALALLVLPVALAVRRGAARATATALTLVLAGSLAAAGIFVLHRSPPGTGAALQAWQMLPALVALPPALVPAELWRWPALLPLAALLPALALLPARLGLGISWSVAAVLCGATFQTGLLLVFGLAATLLDPPRAGRHLVATVAGIAASLGAWVLVARLASGAAIAPGMAVSLLGASLAYPLSAAAYFFGLWPLLSALLLGAALLPAAGSGGDRGTLLVLLAGSVFFGVAAQGLAPRHVLFLLPLALVVALGLPASLAGHGGSRRWLRLVRDAGALVLTLALGIEQWSSIGRLPWVSLEQGRGPLPRLVWRDAPLEQWRRALEALPPEALIITNDDLACMLAGRRPAFLLLPDRAEALRYSLRAPGGSVSIHTGVPVLVGSLDRVRAVAQANAGKPCLVLLRSRKHGFEEHFGIARDLERAAAGGARLHRGEGLLVVESIGG